MASLLDMLFGRTPMATQGGEITGPIGEPQGGLLGNLRNSSGALMGFGMGMLGGANQAEGFQNAMTGMQRGTLTDRQRKQLQEAQMEKLRMQAARKGLAAKYGMDPALADVPGVQDAILQDKLTPKQKSFEERQFEMLTPEQQAAYRQSKFLGGEKQPEDIQKYNFAMRQRQSMGQPVVSYDEWDLARKRASGTNINMPSAERSYDQVVGKDYGERFSTLQKDAANSRTKLGTFDAMETLMDTPGFRSGSGAEFETAVRSAAIGMGADGEKLKGGTAAMEAFRGLATKATVDGLGSLGTGVSNADVQFIQKTNPSLATTPPGNRLQMRILRKMEGRKIEIARKAREYAAKNGGRLDAGFDTELEKWAESNPLLSEEEKTEIAGTASEKGAGGQRQGKAPNGINWVVKQ